VDPPVGEEKWPNGIPSQPRSTVSGAFSDASWASQQVDGAWPWIVGLAHDVSGSRTVRRSGMLDKARVAARLPAQNLERARVFYSEKLGLEPLEERDGGLLYRAAGGEFALFESAGSAPGTFTQMAWEVDDIDATVTELRARGVGFEEVDLPGLKTVNGIADIAGHYPSKGSGERAAWFRDSEGNMLGISQLVP
jgi:catechol 2,3-dioxygenase-like lactoylglutathione lyase family enzyme